MRFRIVSMALTAALLAGCASGPVQPRPSSASATTTAAGDNGESGAGVILPPEEPVSAVTSALLTQSHDQRDAGDLSAAAATIERGLTIDPNDALLWVELAELRMREGNPDLAEEMARKALTLTDSRSAVAARARRLIRR